MVLRRLFHLSRLRDDARGHDLVDVLRIWLVGPMLWGMRYWSRVCPLESLMIVGTTIMLVGAAGGAGMIGYFVTHGERHVSTLAVVGVLGVYLWVVGLTVLAGRVFQAGVFVSATHIRMVYLWRTRTLPWSVIAGIDSRPGRLWGMDTVREAIWLTTTSGERIEAPVQRRQEPLWILGPRRDAGPVLRADVYERAIDLLRACHAKATGVA